MLKCPIDSPAMLLPHSGRMVLLQRVVAYDDISLLAEANISSNHILLPDGAQALPSYLGAEIMAQGIGAWAGVHALNQGKKVRLGFLLGSRQLRFRLPAIPVGTKLTVWVQQSWQDELGMGVFDCELRCQTPLGDFAAGTVLVSGTMNVYAPQQPAELEKLLGKPSPQHVQAA